MSEEKIPARGLLLDFGSVVTLPLFETHELTARELGLPKGNLTWLGPFDPDGDALWRAMQRDEISERDYWLTRTREVGEMIGENWTRMEQFVIRARGRNPKAIIRPEIIPLIAACKSAGKKLAILSNELDLFYGADLRRNLDFMNDFDVISDATYTNILKPDPKAYQHCLDALGLEAEQAVFIDDQQRNIDGGARVGLRSVFLDVRCPQRAFNQAMSELGLTLRFDEKDHAKMLKGRSDS